MSLRIGTLYHGWPSFPRWTSCLAAKSKASDLAVPLKLTASSFRVKRATLASSSYSSCTPHHHVSLKNSTTMNALCRGICVLDVDHMLKRDRLDVSKNESRGTSVPVAGLSSQTATALRMLKEDGPRLYVKALLKGRPFTFSRGDILSMHRLADTNVGDIIRLTEVLEIGSPNFTLRGSYVVNPEWHVVRARVIEHSRGMKVLARRGKQRKGRRKKVSMKPRLSRLEILDISINI